MVIVNGLAVVLTFVARESGKKLFARLDSIGGAGVAAHHRQLGLAFIWYVLVLFAFSLVTWLVVRSRDRGPAPTIVAILTAVAAAVVIYEVIRVGDSRTRAGWGDIARNPWGPTVQGPRSRHPSRLLCGPWSAAAGAARRVGPGRRDRPPPRRRARNLARRASTLAGSRRSLPQGRERRESPGAGRRERGRSCVLRGCRSPIPTRRAGRGQQPRRRCGGRAR